MSLSIGHVARFVKTITFGRDLVLGSIGPVLGKLGNGGIGASRSARLSRMVYGYDAALGTGQIPSRGVEILVQRNAGALRRAGVTLSGVLSGFRGRTEQLDLGSAGYAIVRNVFNFTRRAFSLLIRWRTCG